MKFGKIFPETYLDIRKQCCNFARNITRPSCRKDGRTQTKTKCLCHILRYFNKHPSFPPMLRLCKGRNTAPKREAIFTFWIPFNLQLTNTILMSLMRKPISARGGTLCHPRIFHTALRSHRCRLMDKAPRRRGAVLCRRPVGLHLDI